MSPKSSQSSASSSSVISNGQNENDQPVLKPLNLHNYIGEFNAKLVKFQFNLRHPFLWRTAGTNNQKSAYGWEKWRAE